MMNEGERLHALDSVRGLALLLGIALHASVSFIPGGVLGWPIEDNSPSVMLREAFWLMHMFRMPLFFLLAGLFAHALFHRLQFWGFVRNRAKRIAAPLLLALVIIVPLTLVAIVWGMSRVGAEMPPPPLRKPVVPVPFFHLWFLYLLILFYPTILSARVLFAGHRVRSHADRLLRGLVHAHLVALVLAVPLATALYFDRFWILWEGIPTPAVGLAPPLAALIGYGTAFSAGWLVMRQRELMEVWRNSWPGYLAAAVLLTLTARASLGPVPEFAVAETGAGLRAAYALAYSAGAWCWVIALIGLAQRHFAKPNALRRYLVDASYWMYLVHLPLVWGLASLVAIWPLHWTLKFTFILVASTSVMLVSYEYLVRYTFVGALLNGRRRRSSEDKIESADAGSVHCEHEHAGEVGLRG